MKLEFGNDKFNLKKKRLKRRIPTFDFRDTRYNRYASSPENLTIYDVAERRKKLKLEIGKHESNLELK